MTANSGDSHEQGVEFGTLRADLESESYPLTQEELLDRYGESTIEFESGSSTLREILNPQNERTFEDIEGVRQAVFSMVDEEAIGRDGYSDRGGSNPADPAPEETDSL